MAVQHVVIEPIGGYRVVEFQATEEVTQEIMGHFITTPTPYKQTYSVLKGNAAAGWVNMILGIDWHQDFDMMWYYEASEQPPP